MVKIKPTLEIHILNSGIGESIILKLPNGKWGVVDCYSPSLRDNQANPTLHFLKKNNIHELEFLCITHPHDDHYRGMSQIIKYYGNNIKEFWRFGGINIDELLSYLKINSLENEETKLTDSVEDLINTFATITELKKAGLRVRYINDFSKLYSEQCSIGANKTDMQSIEIFSLGPSSNLVHDYVTTLKECFDETGTIDIEKKQKNHNMISIVLMVKFEKTKIILGADAENKSWMYIMDDHLRSEELSAHAVKISHHGSMSSIINGLWASFAVKDKPFSIVTPYFARSLPQHEAMEHIWQYTDKIASTCLEAIKFSIEKRFESQSAHSLEEQLAMRAFFPKFMELRDFQTGICSLSFDSSGECLQSNFEGDAGFFKPDIIGK